MLNNANPANQAIVEELQQKNKLLRQEAENLRGEVASLESNLQNAQESQASM